MNLIFSLKSRLRSIKNKIDERYKHLKLIRKYIFSGKYNNKFSQYKNKKKILFCLAPNYGNLGDQAIAYAINKFFNDNFKEYIVLEFERDELYEYGKSIRSIINKDDIIVLPGGGNMGNLYPKEEVTRRFLVKLLNKNKIISMPQTISFTKDKKGQKEKAKTAKVYNKNENLVLLAREDKSFDEMKNIFTNKVIEVPDIVLYLENMSEEFIQREVILTCIRNDGESYWKDKKSQFLDNIRESYSNVKVFDTTVNRNIHKDTREEELDKIWSQFKRAKVVITDRLHGMLFSVITKTPCIVLRSLDHKVIESYKWVKNLNYIRFVDNMDFNEINPIIHELVNLELVDNTNFKQEYFNKLVDVLKSEGV